MKFDKLFISIFFLFKLITCPINAQDVQFIANKTNSYFGSLKIFELNDKDLKNLHKNDLIKIYPATLFENKKDDLPPMMGEFIIENEVIYFTPRFLFRPNKKYVVELNLENRFLKTILIPETGNSEPTYVETIFPSAEIWPANQLKIYLHFSAPMGLGNIYDHIKLYKENGQEVEKPFLEIEPPLWDKTQQRLTLWFDPGRIKRHLSPNEKMGPPLEENKKYRLVISKNAKDADGYELSDDFEKYFITALNDRKKPDIGSWEIVLPKRNGEPVIVKFPEPMDRGTLESTIGIIAEDGQVVEGIIAINNCEKKWAFYPKSDWQKGEYKLMFSEKIEDLAGNNLKRLFDQNIDEVKKEKRETPVLEFPFSVK